LDIDRRQALALLRRALFYYLFFTTLTTQAVFLLLLIPGVDFDPRYAVWWVPAGVPIPLTLWRVFVERRRQVASVEPWYVWLVPALLMFGFWAGSYFGIGAVTPAERALRLSFEVDRAIPLWPEFVFLYIVVYPLFLLPFFRAARAATISRVVIGYLTILTVSYAVFLVMPVTFDRPPLPDRGAYLARWVLAIVHRNDPPWNCLPSTHCAIALLAALALWESDRRVGAWGLLTALGIGVSTTLTKQHYLVDVIAGFTLAAITYLALLWISTDRMVAWLRVEVLPAVRRFRSD
jgi:membrane-associated phospholipid phosphatase